MTDPKIPQYWQHSHRNYQQGKTMLEKLGILLFLVLGANNVIQADADPEPERDEFGRVVDHGKVKKYFLELYNEALSKAMRDQETEKEDFEYTRNSEKRGFNFGTKSFSGYYNEKPTSFYNPEFDHFDEDSHPKGFHEGPKHKQGFAGFGVNSVKAPVKTNKHTAHFSGGHKHKHHHHKHSHEHTNDHKHAHKHLHEQSHEHKHSAKHQHVHKHEHHHEHNHHHKHKEDHEHKQDHKHAHKHLHAHKGNSWRRQGDELDHAGRREDNQKEFEPINSEIQLDDDIIEPNQPSFIKKPKSNRPPSYSEYQDIEYDAWEQI